MKIRFIYILVLSFLVVSIVQFTEYSARYQANLVSKEGFFDSPDTEDYLSFAQNLIKYGEGISGYKPTNPPAKGSYFGRTPGYSIFIYISILFLGEKYGIWAVLFFNHLLFFLSLYCLNKILAYIKIPDTLNLFICFLYAVLPFFYTWSFYILTEPGSYPFFVFYIYFLLKAYNTSNVNSKILNYVVASLFLGYGILIRPYIGISWLVIAYYLYLDYVKKQKFLMPSFILSIPALIILVWGIRNYINTGELVLLMKQHPSTLNLYKKEYFSLWKFVRCWEPDGSKMNEVHLPMFYAAIKKGDTSQVYREKFLAIVPDYITQVVSKSEINQSLVAYQTLLLSQKKYYDKNIPMPSEYTPEQLKVAAIFDDFIRRFKQKYPLRHYVLNPLKQLKLIVLHSNTAHIYLFQEPFRHIQILNFMRYGLVLFHVSLYVVMFLNLWWIKTNFGEVLIISIIPLLLVLFFMFIFQAVEQRYMLPFLPALFIGLGFFMNKIVSLRIKNRNYANS
ncbi:MAG: hypothetical protein NZ455_15240 [Bacteroidia bacterium]|nr:hypothetical protein [Bacteroidia bacterium]